MWRAAALVLLLGGGVLAADPAALYTDRAAIERVYHEHRTGTKAPFEQAMPRELIEKLTRADLHKESVLRKVYGVEITPAQLAGEVKRIETTTRAPEMLAEIKAALGHDPARFATSFAKPILVEQLLRSRFDNDDALHAARRRECDTARQQLLEAKRGGADPARLVSILKSGHPREASEVTWQLGLRPAGKVGTAAADEAEIRKRFGPGAQILSPSSAGADKEQQSYFEDLPGDLQTVLRVQLRQAGDVSAVIETPTRFLLFVASEVNATVLRAASLSLPKLDYDEWLATQPD